MTQARSFLRVEPLEARRVPTIVNIDPSWLAEPQNGGPNGPYLLKPVDPGSDTTYVLQTDVQVDGTAFFVGAPDNNYTHLSLDLNGHVIDYDRASPLTIYNGDFELPGSTGNIPGWDLTQAPTATVVPSIVGMFGSQMCQITNFDTPQILRTDPFPVPVVGQEYTAAISLLGDANVAHVYLRVIDAATHQLLSNGYNGRAQGDSHQPAHGFSSLTSFVTSTANQSVQLEVEVDPAEGHAASFIDLDYAAVMRSRNYGVVASPASAGELPVQLRQMNSLDGSGNNYYQHTHDFTVRNGTIVQGPGVRGAVAGTAYGYASSPVNLYEGGHMTVDDVFAEAVGMDTDSIDNVYGSNVTFTNNHFADKIDRISDRTKWFSVIHMEQFVGGTADVENNTVAGNPAWGILYAAGTPNVGPLTIKDNVFHARASVADPYAIAIDGANDFEVAGNQVGSPSAPSKGRGMLVDSYGAIGTTNGKIHDNYFNVYEQPILEYGANGIEATAFRVRNDNYNLVQEQFKRNLIYNNRFIAHTDPDGTDVAIAVRLTLTFAGGQNSNADNFFANNFCGAYVDSEPGTYHGNSWYDAPVNAAAFVASEVMDGTGLRLVNNTFESNDIAVNIGDILAYGENEGGMTFLGNQLSHLAYGPDYADYAGIIAGSSDGRLSNMSVLNNRFSDGFDRVNNLFQPPRRYFGDFAGYNLDANKSKLKVGWETPQVLDPLGHTLIAATGLEDGHVYYTTSNDAGDFGDWQPTYPDAPLAAVALSATLDPTGLPELFAIGTDNKLYTQTLSLSTAAASGGSWRWGWSPWTLVDGSIPVSGISATTDADGNPVVFAINTGDNDYVYGITYSQGGWGGWVLTTPLSVTGISATPDVNGDLEVYGIGASDKDVYVEYSTGPGQWSSWNLTEAGQAKEISVVNLLTATGVGRTDLYAILVDDQVWQNQFDGSTWQGYQPTAQKAVRSVSVILDGNENEDVIAVGMGAADNQVWLETMDAMGQWVWNSLPQRDGGFNVAW
jgi:hypothetical protein